MTSNNTQTQSAPSPIGTVYMIHFDSPYHHARHYVGFATEGNLEQRIMQHSLNIGANLLVYVNNAGIGWQVVRTWSKQSRAFERTIKNRKNTPKYCPICNPQMRHTLSPKHTILTSNYTPAIGTVLSRKV